MAECKYCKAEIKWPTPYQKGMKPLNPDGSTHSCRNNSTPPAEPKPEPEVEAPKVSEFGSSKIRIFKLKKVIMDLETNDIILTVEELS